MAFAAKDASGNTIYIAGTGAGTVNDPIVPTQAVTGPLTDTQLRAADVKVSLDGEAVAVTGPLTDAELRAAVVLVGPVDSATGVLMTIDYAHHEIHGGSSFSYQDVIQLGSGGTQDYLLTVPDSAKWPHFNYETDGIYGITLEIFEATDKAGTTPQAAYNRNRNSATAPTMTIHKGTSGGTTDGTRIAWRKSGSGTAGGKLAATVHDTDERMLKQNTKYIVRITSAAASNDITVRFDWYEHTNR